MTDLIGRLTAFSEITPEPDNGFSRLNSAARSLIMEAVAALSEKPNAAIIAAKALADITTERQRQIGTEGWTPKHDDQHDKGELAKAAACYTLADSFRASFLRDCLWPWSLDWWKPTDRRRDLIKAGALIVAEIERLDRAAIARARGGQA
jgi:hypothetical protein